VLHILSLCVGLVVQHTVRMRRIILSSVACLDVPNFVYIISKAARFEEIHLLNMKCVFGCHYSFCLKLWSF